MRLIINVTPTTSTERETWLRAGRTPFTHTFLTAMKTVVHPDRIGLTEGSDLTIPYVDLDRASEATQRLVGTPCVISYKAPGKTQG